MRSKLFGIFASLAFFVGLAFPFAASAVDFERAVYCESKAVTDVQAEITSYQVLTAQPEVTLDLRRFETFSVTEPETNSANLTVSIYESPRLTFEVGWRTSYQL